MNRARTTFFALLFIIVVGTLFWRLFDIVSPEANLIPHTTEGEAATDLLAPRRAPVTPTPVRITPTPQEVKPHRPIHDDRLVSGTARAEFLLVDARGRRLPESVDIEASAFRLFEGVRLREKVNVDRARGVIEVTGHAGGGLEPGDYVLQLEAGPYAARWIDFSLARDDRLRRTITLDTWTRVVRLEFVDEAGNPIDRIPYEPRYKVEDLPLEERAFVDRPAAILRAPPGLEEPGQSGFGLGGSSGGRRARPRAWQTQEGAWYLTVVARSLGTLSLTLHKKDHGRESFEVESRFDQPHEDVHRIVLSYSEKARSKLARAAVGNPYDPGRQSSLSWERRRDAEVDPAELPTELSGWARVIFRGVPSKLSLDVAGRLRGMSLHHMGFRYSDRRPRASNGVPYVDVDLRRSRRALDWRWTDGALFESKDEGLTIEPTGDRRGMTVIEKTVEISALPLEVRVEGVSPTFDAWARDLSMAWAGGPVADRMYAARRIPRERLDPFVVATARRVDTTDAELARRSVSLRFRGDAIVSAENLALRGVAPVDGVATVAPMPGGLALRAVDERGDGLPFVEASLMEVEGRASAEAVKTLVASASLPDSGDRPRTWFRSLDRGSSPDDIKAVIGHELWEALRHDDVRLHLARNGTWYDTWRRLKGDDRGYVIDTGQKLQPGRRYLLWLWSRSRSDMSPDRMLVFEATEGLTDLGVVVLPRWHP